jgi:phosphate-selective porin OprO/OprP
MLARNVLWCAAAGALAVVAATPLAARAAAPAESAPAESKPATPAPAPGPVPIVAPAPEPARAAAAPALPPVLTAGSEGFALKSGDGKFVLKLRGYLQADARIFPVKAEPGTTSFLIRNVRLIMEGTLFEWFDFRIMPDFGEGKFELREAWLDIHAWKFLRLRAGKFKEPFGLERLQTDTTINFVERALPTSLVPNRDVGLQIWGDVLDGTFAYAVGLFDGVPDGGSVDGDNSDDKDIAARVFVQPFKKLKIAPLAGLGVGFAVTFGKQAGTATAPNLPTFRSPGQVNVFSYLSDMTAAGTVVADGTRLRLSPQAYWYWGPVGLLFEYVRSDQGVTKDVDSTRLTHTSWQLAGYFVFGGNATYDGVKPSHPFAPDKGAWGAVEIGARFHELDLDDDAFPLYADPEKSVSLVRSVGGGAHWYLNNNVKLALDFEHSFFTGGATGPVDRPAEDVLLGRFQIAF